MLYCEQAIRACSSGVGFLPIRRPALSAFSRFSGKPLLVFPRATVAFPCAALLLLPLAAWAQVATPPPAASSAPASPGAVASPPTGSAPSQGVSAPAGTPASSAPTAAIVAGTDGSYVVTRPLTLADVVSWAVNTNSAVILARQRLDQARERRNDVSDGLVYDPILMGEDALPLEIVTSFIVAPCARNPNDVVIGQLPNVRALLPLLEHAAIWLHYRAMAVSVISPIKHVP